MAERLTQEAASIRAEGWRWIEIAPDFPYGHGYGLRQLRGEERPLTEEEAAERLALQADYDQLEAAHAGDAEVSDAVDQRVSEIEARLAALDERPLLFDPAEIARAGAFVSIDGDGRLRVARGYVRPEDELPVAPAPEVEPEAEAAATSDGTVPAAAMAMRVDSGAAVVQAGPDMVLDTVPAPEEDEGIKPLPDRLLAELTTHRTLALRHALGDRPDIAFLAALHAFCLKLFYPYAQDSCLELDLKSIPFSAQAPGLSETVAAKAIGVRHQGWAATLPREAADLWDGLAAFDDTARQGLFAHCIGASVNAVHEAWSHRPRALAHADRLAEAVRLDMEAAGWTPTVETYLGRVTKARILQAVREGAGQPAAQRIEHLRKDEMADQAQLLLAGCGWLPEPLRTPGQIVTAMAAVSDGEAEAAADTAQPEVDAKAEAVPRAAE